MPPRAKPSTPRRKANQQHLSRYIIRHKDDYYRLLLDVTRQEAWEPWLLYMLRAVESTAVWTMEKIAAIEQQMTKMLRDDVIQAYAMQAAAEIEAEA